jgi:hypothetical protein
MCRNRRITLRLRLQQDHAYPAAAPSHCMNTKAAYNVFPRTYFFYNKTASCCRTCSFSQQFFQLLNTVQKYVSLILLSFPVFYHFFRFPFPLLLHHGLHLFLLFLQLFFLCCVPSVCLLFFLVLSSFSFVFSSFSLVFFFFTLIISSFSFVFSSISLVCFPHRYR